MEVATSNVTVMTTENPESKPVRTLMAELGWFELAPPLEGVDELPPEVFELEEEIIGEELKVLDVAGDGTDPEAVDALAVVPLAAPLEFIEPSKMPFAGVTGDVEPCEFWYGTLPASWAAEVTFHPLAFMRGYAVMNA